jgi:3-mercaptopyruvate sulfurtransferase SseA
MKKPFNKENHMPKRKNTKPPFPIFLFIGGGIALIAAAFLLISQNNSATPAPAEPIAEEIPYPEIARASLEEAKAALDLGAAILVDVRSAEAFASQHIAGAVNIPTAELESRLGELDPNAWIIPYCT